MTLGMTITKYKNKQKMSTEELAAKLPMKRKIVESWENDKIVPTEAQLERIVKILKIPASEVDAIYLIQRNVSNIENTGMMILFMTMLVLLGYFLPFYKDTSALSFLFTPDVDLRLYAIPYISLWLNFLGLFSIIVMTLVFFLKANYSGQKKIYNFLKYPMIISSISILFFLSYGFKTIYIGYFYVVIMSIVLMVYYFIRMRKMVKLGILTKGEHKDVHN